MNTLTQAFEEKPTDRQEGLSYKFQRLRERLRQAIASGQLSGKLPGERALSKRFDANPKTIGKALTDLAAEGLLDRSIGRGTYTKGSVATPAGHTGRWMVLCDAGQANSPVAAELFRLNPQSQMIEAREEFRPSFLNQFSAFIDLCASGNDALHRALLVRGASVVLVGRESAPYRTHSVLLDSAHAAATLGRDMLLAGHRSILIVEGPGQAAVLQAVRMAAARYLPFASVRSCSIDQLGNGLDSETFAVLCADVPSARQASGMLQHRPDLPRVSLAAIGVCAGEPPCTGIYAAPAEVAAAVAQLLAEQTRHPTTLWLAGKPLDRRTIHPAVEVKLDPLCTAPPVALSA